VLIELLQERVGLLIDDIQEASYVHTLQDHTLSGGCFTSSRVVWNPGIIFSFSLVQLMEHQFVMTLLEDKQSLGREDCNVLIGGFLCFAVGGDLMSLCQLDQMGKMRLI
jgi:hypothetical protein